MSTIERLRELLEERGVKWWESKGYGTSIIYTFWSSPTFGRVYAIENDDGTLFMASLNNCDFTPEQAVAATLDCIIIKDKSRWYELFGTPERAARTLSRFCTDCFCGDCTTCGVPEWADYRRDYDAVLEWLGGAAE